MTKNRFAPGVIWQCTGRLVAALSFVFLYFTPALAMEVHIEWEPIAEPYNAYLDHYVIHWRPENVANFGDQGSGSKSFPATPCPTDESVHCGTIATADGLEDGVVYFFTMKSVASDGFESPFAKEEKLLYIDALAPGYYVNQQSNSSYPIWGHSADPATQVNVVEVKDVLGKSSLANMVVALDGTWTAALDITTLAEGAVYITANSGIVYSKEIAGTYDATPPAPPSVAGITLTNATTTTWTWTGGGGGNGTFRHKMDNTDLGSEATVSESTSFTPATDLSEGSHTLYVQERDAAGNWSSSGTLTVVVDITPPGVPTVSGATPTNDTTPTWTWAGGGGGNGTYRYQLDNEVLGAEATLGEFSSFTPATNLSEGSHTLYVQERDAAGNWSPSGTLTVIVDITPPGTPAVSGATLTNATTPTWTWEGGGGGKGTYRYQLDNEVLGAEATLGEFSGFTPATNLSEGSHTLYVQERDAAGNWSSSGTLTVIVDITPPGAPVVSGTTLTNATTPTWTWAGGGGGNGTYRYRLDNKDLGSQATVGTFTSFTPSTDLSEGSHTLYVQEQDAAGNWSSSGELTIATIPVSVGWSLLSSTIDLQVPEVFGDAGAFTSIWKWTDDGKGGKTWAIYLPGGDSASYAASKDYVLLSTISSGEGFWLNSKVTKKVAITGTPAYGPLVFSSGWSLLGIKGTQPVEVTDLGAVISVWMWSGDTWAVYLSAPADKGAAYAQAKGFDLLSTIPPGKGFWVNKQE